MAITCLLITNAEAEKLIQNQIHRGKAISNSVDLDEENLDNAIQRVDAWEAETRQILIDMFDSEELADEFTRAAALYQKGQDLMAKLGYTESRVTYKNYALEDIKKRLSFYEESTKKSKEVSQSEDSPEKYVKILDRISLRFHTVVRQLRNRHDDRPTLDVQDEYDVQDLLHSMLRLFFDDVREEEYSPSYAGGSSRVDFLVKQEEFVIEVKKTRASLKAKQLGEQLIIDIARYKEHPSCKFLYCFVYDPNNYISNPQGIENDLSRTHDGLQVKVFIAPKSH